MTEKTLKDLEGKVSEEEQKQAEDAKAELSAALEAGNLEDIRTKKDKLNEIVQALTMKMYEQAAAEAQAAEGAEGSKTDDGVVDAEFEEVNDEEVKK